MHALGEPAGADQREPHGAAARRQRLRVLLDRRHGRLSGRGVRQQDQQRPVGRLQRGVGLVCLFDGVGGRNQRPHLDPPVGDQPQVFGHVAVFGPAHVGQRIVGAALLVGRVVAARPVRARDEEIELLGVHVGAVQVQANITDQHDPSLAPAHPERARDDGIGGRRGRDDHTVGAAAVAQPHHLIRVGAVVGAHRRVHAQLLGKGEPPGVEVDADDAAAVGAQQLRGDLSEHAQADYHKRLTQRRRRAAHALHGDRAERHRAGIVEADAVGNTGHQVLGNADDFGVMGALRTGAGHAIAGPDSFQPGADLDDDAGGGIAGRGAGAELPLDDVPRPVDAHRGDGLNDFLGVFGIARGKLPQRQAAALQSAQLGPDGNAGPLHGHQCRSRFKRRRGDVVGDGFAPANENLLHR